MKAGVITCSSTTFSLFINSTSVISQSNNVFLGLKKTNHSSRFETLITNSDKFSKKRIHTAAASVMASAFKHEQARVPPAVRLPIPPVTKFKIALCQLSVTEDKERNIAHARKAIEEAAAKGVQLVLLPELYIMNPHDDNALNTNNEPIHFKEIWNSQNSIPYLETNELNNTIGDHEIWNSPYSNDSFPTYAEDIDSGADASPSTAMLSEAARSLQITIVGGSIPERCGDRLYNTCCVFGKDGKLIAKHRKIHLFDIDIPGKITFKESNTLTAGDSPTIVDTDVGRIGIGICYDIRFQELATVYAARGAHLLCYPGAFNMTTGPLHWELLQRARAADNQLYVATCSPARDAGAGYIAWGHSTLVGPFGEVLATTDHEEAIIIAEIDYSEMELRRTNLPLQKQRRGDLYQLVDVQRLNSAPSI